MPGHSWFRVAYVEARKHFLLYYRDWANYLPALVWPILGLAGLYYSLRPFAGAGTMVSMDTLTLFVLTGYLGYTFFYCLVQSAWRLSFERYEGTLELGMLTPAPRTAIIVGNAAGGLIEGTWAFTVFFVGLGFAFHQVRLHPGMLLISLAVLSAGALAWGSLLNSLFLLTRDSAFLFTILDDPMSFFSGMRFPVVALPMWGRFVSYLFPLTWTLGFLRGALVDGKSFGELSGLLILNAVIDSVAFALMYVLVRVADAHARRTGQYSLF